MNSIKRIIPKNLHGFSKEIHLYDDENVIAWEYFIIPKVLYWLKKNNVIITGIEVWATFKKNDYELSSIETIELTEVGWSIKSDNLVNFFSEINSMYNDISKFIYDMNKTIPNALYSFVYRADPHNM